MSQIGSVVESAASRVNTESPDHRTLRESGLFDREWYLRTYVDVAQSGAEPLTHYLACGALEGRSPNPLFDTAWYLRRYADVAASGMNPLLHYIRYGAAEDRWPNEMFDGAWYRTRYPDVDARSENPLADYLRTGATGSRDPHPEFSGRWYARAYPEFVRTATTPLEHFLRSGRAAGLLPVDPNAAANAAYAALVRHESLAQARELDEIRWHIKVMPVRPTFLVTHDCSDANTTRGAVAGLEGQVYPDWVASMPLNWGDIAAALLDATADTFVVFVRPGDVLHPRALYALAAALNADPQLDCIYVDEDRLGAEGARSRPFWKPDWSPDHLESANYIGYGAGFRASCAREHLASATSYYDFVLRFTEQPRSIGHVREILYHRDEANVRATSAEHRSDIAALEGRLYRTARSGTVEPLDDSVACYEVRTAVSSSALVSIVIVTGDQTRRVDALVKALAAIRQTTTYANIEILVVALSDLSAEQRRAIEARAALVGTDSLAPRSASAAANLGVAQAGGEFVILLDVGVEPITPDWMERLLAQFHKPHVGVVGAKLLNVDHSVAHAGMVLGHDAPAPIVSTDVWADDAFFGNLAATRNYSAVSGACLMTRTAVFHDVGGLSADLGPGFADVDFCLKVAATGRFTVFVPGATLVHANVEPRTARHAVADAELFASRWGRFAGADPFYNADRLTLSPPTYELRSPGTRF